MLKLTELKAQVKSTGAIIDSNLDLRYRASWEYLYTLFVDPLYSDVLPVYKSGKTPTEIMVPSSEEKWRALEDYLHSKVKTKSAAHQPIYDYESFLPSEELIPRTLERVDLREPCLTSDGQIDWEHQIKHVLDVDIFCTSEQELEEAIKAGFWTYSPDILETGVSDYQRFCVVVEEARARLKDLRFNGYANYLDLYNQ